MEAIKYPLHDVVYQQVMKLTDQSPTSSTYSSDLRGGLEVPCVRIFSGHIMCLTVTARSFHPVKPLIEHAKIQLIRVAYFLLLWNVGFWPVLEITP